MSETRIAKHIQSLPKSGIRDFFELVNTMDDVVSLGIGEPDFVTPWHIREAAIYSLEIGHTSYTSNLGLMSLRKEVCRYVERLFGTRYEPSTECIITVGVSEALDLVLRAILNPGDEVIYHEPCFVSYAPGIRMTHAVPVPVTTHRDRDFALDPADLRAAITPRTRVILLNFPCNPTGATLDHETLLEIADIAKEHDLLIISDEIYSELTYEGEHVSIASLPEMRERTILLHGFSKAYAMTGFRLGFACGPADLIDAMMKIHQYSMMSAQTTAQEAGVEALRNGWNEMVKMRDVYRQRRDVIVKELNDIGLPCFKPRGSFYVFPDIRRTGLNAQEFSEKLLKEQQVAVVPGTAFGACGEGHVRCAYAASMENILTAMDRLGEFVSKLI